MSIFQHALWGYELTYGDDWTHRKIKGADGFEAEAFAANPDAFEPDYEGSQAGQVAVRAEWNYASRVIEKLWTERIGLMAGMMGARKVGSAPWQLRDATGIEAEIVLPKSTNTRLWAGILSHGRTILHFMVTHPVEERPWFEPLATRLIASLRFPSGVAGLEASGEGLPLPAGYRTVDPRQIVADAPVEGALRGQHWRAYDGSDPAGALQAFYLREAPNFGWTVEEYLPFPGEAGLGFARLQLRRTKGANGQGTLQAMLGIMPYGEGTVSANSPARLVVKFNSL
jgi:hypothetical protein